MKESVDDTSVNGCGCVLTMHTKTGSGPNMSHSLSVFAIEGHRRADSSLLRSGELISGGGGGEGKA